MRPVAGDDIASRCVDVILGGRNPDVVLDTSSFADSVVDAERPIATPPDVVFR